jgi:dUTP pyrophosphatase
MSIKIKFKKVHPEAKLPTQANVGDAAFDLYCVEDFGLQAGQTALVRTGLKLASVDNTHVQDIFLHIVGRSRLAKEGIFPIGGIVDTTYRGEIGVLLHNGNPPKPSMTSWGHTSLVYPSTYFKAGDRIAQVVIQVIATNSGINSVSFEETEEVDATTRGEGGFGSTGR